MASPSNRAKKNFADLVNTINGIVWEADLVNFEFTYVSQFAQELLGYPLEDWYRSGFWMEIMHPDDRARVLQYCQECLADRVERYECEYRVIAADGREVWLQDMATMAMEGSEPTWLRGIMIDITKSKTTASQVSLSRARFEAIFQSAPVGILLVDAESHQIVEMNQAYCQLVGRSRQQVIAEGWETYTHPDDLHQEMSHVINFNSASTATSNCSYVKRYLKPDGQEVSARLQAVEIETSSSAEGKQYIIILEDITERQEFENKIWRQANYDLLTELPNRNLFQDRASQLIKDYPRNQQKFAVLMLDLDGFKHVNDTMGHDMGDEMLIQASQRIEACIRTSDTLARLGGDEFVIVLTNVKDRPGIETVANKIAKAMAEEFELLLGEAFVSASIGITLYPDDADAFADLLKNADQAMYLAKNRGRNRHQFFTDELRQEARKRADLVSDLRIATDNQAFQLHYQPIIEIASGKVQKAEALIRWQHEERGWVSPVDFIPLAEETRLITEIGDWVFRTATEQVRQWQQNYDNDFQINVNTSPMQLESEIVSNFLGYMQEAGIDGRNIGIEITESLFMTSHRQVIETLEGFRDAGIEVSLDDFGTGYSSLSYLRKFDIDYLKIDRSFVQNLSIDSDDFALCAAIIVMAHRLGIRVVAEGIETEEQRDLLRSIDCDFGQGFYYSKALPAEEFEQQFLT